MTLDSDPTTEAGTLDDTASRIKQLQQELRKVVIGQDAVLDQMIIALLSSGHALLEGVPGTAKTLAVRAMALALSCDAKRVQFTPDLMPSDIVGTNVFNLQANTFDLHRGPVFTDLLLADEINRAPAKTQSALLEAMAERRCTIDGVTHQLSPFFTVFATQNPIEYEGTYPLPEAQQDRFLLKIRIDYPAEVAERELLEAFHRGDPPDALQPGTIESVCDADDLAAMRQSMTQVQIEPAIMDYVLKLCRATRNHEAILVGAGPRGSIALLTVAKARALVAGRDYVTPDDVVEMVEPVLGHRITLTAESEIGGASVREVLRDLLDAQEVPR
ncbi:MAG: MoxR family ATPase [Phycisphaeraceae bacterium]